MTRLDLVGAAIGMVEDHLDGPSGRELGQSDDVDGVVDPHEVVVSGVCERQGQHALLLEVRLVDAGEGADDDRFGPHVPRFHRRVLAGRALAVVLVADRDPRDAGLLVPLGEVGQRHGAAVAGVDALTRLAGRERVVRADEEVAADVGEVAAEAQPLPRRRDVVGGALARRLHQHPQAVVVPTVPRRERREQLEPLAGRVDRDGHARRVGGRADEAGLARVEATLGSSSATGATRRTSVPSGAVIVSVTKSTSSRPVSAIAVTVSGEPMNDSVDVLPSLRAGKLRLNDETIVFTCPGSMSSRCHWPMHGPHAFASTVAPIASRSASRPSRSMVARICSEPGDTSSGVFTRSPAAAAWRAMLAARPMSS